MKFPGVLGRANGSGADSGAHRPSKISETPWNRGGWMRGAAVGLLLALAGCHLSAVESDKILVDTRGIPIARVVIEGVGPGGENDLVPVTYERVIETGVFISDPPLVMFLWGAAITACVCWCMAKRKRGKQ